MALIVAIYALSWGPAGWLALRGHIPEALLPLLEMFYRPMETFLWHLYWVWPEQVEWYRDLWL